MKLSKKYAGLIASAGSVTAAVLGIDYLHRLASSRTAPKMKVVSQTQQAVNGGRSNFTGVISEGYDWLSHTPSEKIYITSFDGLRLCGHLITHPAARRTVLFMHGFRSSWQHDFGAAAKDLYDAGCNLLFAEQRAHGESEGKYITYGIYERFDCAEWFNCISRRFGSLPAYGDGISMGATTVLMATGLKLPGCVKGIIADCGFTSPKAIMTSVFRQHSKLPAWLVIPEVSLYSRLRAGFSFSDYSTLDAMRVNTLPIFFAHGDADDFVPLSMTIENYQACKAPKYLLVVPGAGHGMSYLIDHDTYLESLLNFFDDCEKSDSDMK